MVYGVLDGCLWYMAQYGRMIVAHILLIVAVSFSGMMRTFFLAWFDIVPYCACQASIQDEVTAAIVVAWCAGETSEGLERSEGGRSCVACCLERPEVLETSTCCVKVYRWVVVSKISDRMK
jgi:hypothetical protein